MSATNNSFCFLGVDEEEKHIFMALTSEKSAFRYKINNKQKCTFKN
jgi:hypothetical protein